jgi:hypothetical protein
MILQWMNFVSVFPFFSEKRTSVWHNCRDDTVLRLIEARCRCRMRLLQESIGQFDSVRLSCEMEALADDFFNLIFNYISPLIWMGVRMAPRKVSEEKRSVNKDVSGEGRHVCKCFRKLSSSKMLLSQEKDGSTASSQSSATLHCYRVALATVFLTYVRSFVQIIWFFILHNPTSYISLLIIDPCRKYIDTVACFPYAVTVETIVTSKDTQQ